DRALARKHKFPLIINVSGTYRLKESLVNNGTDETFRVITGGVTIDLNGLSLTGSGVENAISITEGLVTVENGTISNFRAGVDAPTATLTARGLRIILSSTAIGTGVRCGAGSIVSGNTLIGSGSNATGVDCFQSII